VNTPDRREYKVDKYNSSMVRRDFLGSGGQSTMQVVNTVFRESVHQILEKIKNDLYFKCPNKMGGHPSQCNQSLHCQYHQDRGQTIEDCRTL